MKSVLPYDVSQEQYLFDEDGFMKKSSEKHTNATAWKHSHRRWQETDFNNQSSCLE